MGQIAKMMIALAMVFAVASHGDAHIEIALFLTSRANQRAAAASGKKGDS